jgi:exonuclease VII large subunit
MSNMKTIILDFLYIAIGLTGIVPLRTNSAAPNPKIIAEKVLSPFERDWDRHQRELEQKLRDVGDPYAPKRDQSLEGLKQAIDHADQEIERINEERRTLIAAMHARLDREEEDIAARTAEVAALRTALGPRPEETQETTRDLARRLAPENDHD